MTQVLDDRLAHRDGLAITDQFLCKSFATPIRRAQIKRTVGANSGAKAIPLLGADQACIVRRNAHRKAVASSGNLQVQHGDYGYTFVFLHCSDQTTRCMLMRLWPCRAQQLSAGRPTARSDRWRLRPAFTALPLARALGRRCSRCKEPCRETMRARRRCVPTVRASACTRPCPAAPTSACGWNNCGGPSRERHWPTSACNATPPGRWFGGSRPPDVALVIRSLPLVCTSHVSVSVRPERPERCGNNNGPGTPLPFCAGVIHLPPRHAACWKSVLHGGKASFTSSPLARME